MRRSKLKLWHFIALLLFVYFYRKLYKSTRVMQFLIEESEKLDQYDFTNNEYLNIALKEIPSPAILLLNKHALNITINFICNIYNFDGIRERLLIFAFDDTSFYKLQKSFPDVHLIRWKLDALSHKFSAGDGGYQLFQYFRARLAQYLAKHTIAGFWMIQSDTIWTKNLFTLIDVNHDKYKQADAIFDAEGHAADGSLLSSMVAGGYFFVRRGHCGTNFFNAIGNFLLAHFSTDNNLMTKFCVENFAGCNCASIPYSILSNWRNQLSSNETSALFQFDGGESQTEKLVQMREKGFLFVELDSLLEASESSTFSNAELAGVYVCHSRNCLI